MDLSILSAADLLPHNNGTLAHIQQPRSGSYYPHPYFLFSWSFYVQIMDSEVLAEDSEVPDRWEYYGVFKLSFRWK
jgi:hypothetical protein